MTVTKVDLQGLAKAVAEKAYAPYSQFPVGAAIAVNNYEQTVVGCNVENASFGLTICAERNAIAAAAAQGIRPGDINELVIYIDRDELFSPCGACRQVIAEFLPSNAQVTAYNRRGEEKVWTVAGLLPDGFRMPEDD